MSDDLHSHMNSVHLKIRPFECETYDGYLHTREALSQGGLHARCTPKSTCAVTAGKFPKVEEVFKTMHTRMAAVYFTTATGASYVLDTGIS